MEVLTSCFKTECNAWILQKSGEGRTLPKVRQLPNTQSVDSLHQTGVHNHLILGTLRNHDSNANENVTWKYKFMLPVLLCAYSNSFNFYNVAELSSHRTGGNGLQVSTENDNLLSCAHALHKTLNLGISRFVWPKMATKCIKICNARAQHCLPH